MNKLGTAIGGLLLIGALAAPVAFAHYDTGAHPVPYATTGLDIFKADDDPNCGQIAVPLPAPYNGFIGPNCGPGGTSILYAGPGGADGVDSGGIPTESVFTPGQDRVSGWYYGSTNTYLEFRTDVTLPNPNPPPATINPSFLFAQWGGVYDAEVGGPGNCGNQADETVVDGLPSGGAVADGIWNDGGHGAVGHTFGHYACAAYETAGCDRYDQAWAEDLVGGEDVWIGAQCNWGVPTGGVGPGLGAVLNQFVNSLVNCPLGGFPQSCIDALNYLDNCLTGGVLLPPAEPPGAYPGCGVVGGTVVCGAGTVSNIDFGRGQGSDGPANPGDFPDDNGAWYPNAGTDSNAANCDAFATATCFPFTGAIVSYLTGQVVVEEISAATYGWCA